MSETKHTPGEWTATQYWADPDCTGELLEAEIEVEGGPTIATLDFTGPGNKNAPANLRLMLSAPKLFEALKRLRNEAVADGMKSRAGWDCWIAAADAALALATEA